MKLSGLGLKMQKQLTIKFTGECQKRAYGVRAVQPSMGVSCASPLAWLTSIGA